MKNFLKRGISLLLCIVFVLCSSVFTDVDIFNGIKLSVYAVGENYYRINDKNIKYDTVDAGNNNDYISSMYKYIWGVAYTDDFNSSDNILKNFSYDERELNDENLKNYIRMCEAGAVLKVEEISNTEVSSANGRTFLIVSSDRNGFSVFEYTDERHETYYTWAHFCEIYTFSTIRFIKWPNSFYASTVGEDADYKKPTRALYYDSVEMLHGDDVRWVQQKLVDAGYKLSVDGYFGKRTEQAVKLFQIDFSLNETGIVDSTTADLLEMPTKKPKSIELSVDTSSCSSDLSVGDVLTVTWDKVDYADSYHIFVYNSRGKLVDELEKVTTNKASFVLNTSGTYTIKGCAQNAVYVGDTSTMVQKVKVHNTYTVSFVDYDGTLLNKQAVAYGEDAYVPASPKRTGYSFKGWDKELTDITSSLTVTAQYIQKSYTVTFKDGNGKTISTQSVLYGESANAPDTSKILGFVAWDTDFSAVTKSMTVNAVVRYASDDLPFTITDTSAKRESESSGYTVNFTVINTLSNKKIARAVVALKTTAGKFLTLTESSAFTVSANGSKTLKIFVPYSKCVTVVEIYVVENYSKLIPISKVATITNIDTTDNYTDWLPDSEAPSTYNNATEYRTEYSYRTKSFTSSKTPSLSGWTRYNISYITSDSGWSSWSTNPVGNAFTTTQCGNTIQTTFVETKNESYITSFNIFGYQTRENTSKYFQRNYWNYNHGAEYQKYGQHHWTRTISTDTWYNMIEIAPGCKSSGSQWGYNKSSATGRQCDEGHIWWIGSNNYNNVTYYRYKYLNINYTYYYYKWNGWSSWSTNAVSSSDNVEVKTRKTRRYDVSDPTISNTGKTRIITGMVDSSLAGRQATLFIYKIGEASDYTNEYVGQSEINSNGSYNFTFKLLDEPTVESGDYTVALGIEGTNSVIYLDKIEAPKAQYTVNVCDWDGTVISTQTVNRGESAVLPTTNPTRPGYTFAGWNYSNASIYEDTDITALYVQDEYTVTFIDWANEKFIMQTGYHYGDTLVVPDLNYLVGIDKNGNETADESEIVNYKSQANEAYVSEGWSGVFDGMTVTKNMVITAKYDTKEYTVRFYDYDKNIISEQTVQYGEAADLPILSPNSDCIFLSWDNDEYDCVTDNIDIYPVYCYNQTVETPNVDIDSGVYSQSQTLTLKCNTPNSTIYYTIDDGSGDLINGEYTEPITISKSSKVIVNAVADKYNSSENLELYYAINTADNTSTWQYPVKYYIDNKLVATELVLKDSLLDEGKILSLIETGSKVSGLFTDSYCSNAWNISTDKVTSETSIYIKTDSQIYTVKFCYEDRTVISQQSIEYLGSATAPKDVNVDNGKVFIGWDSDKYLCVTEDMIITANVKNSSEIANITLDRTSMIMISGMSYQLNVTISLDEFKENNVLWETSNKNVATVSNDGLVTAVAPGQATITVTLSGDILRTAICEVNVKPNSEEDITFISTSKLYIENGKLRGVLPSSNYVSDVFVQINSVSVASYSSEGKQLNYSDKMETGSTVCLVDKNGTIRNSATVIVLGDVNSDGVVNNKDAALLHKYIAGKAVDKFNEDTLLAADVNSDGSITQKDVSIILQYIQGKDTILSA